MSRTTQNTEHDFPVGGSIKDSLPQPPIKVVRAGDTRTTGPGRAGYRYWYHQPARGVLFPTISVGFARWKGRLDPPQSDFDINLSKWSLADAWAIWGGSFALSFLHKHNPEIRAAPRSPPTSAKKAL